MTELIWELLQAARTHPLPREQVIARLLEELHRQVDHLITRPHQSWQATYEEGAISDVEAIISAILYLQLQEEQP